MIDDLDPKAHYVAFWFTGDGRTRDWFAVLMRTSNLIGSLELRYRFRYYGESHSAFDSDDEKQYRRCTMPGKTEAEGVAIVDEMFENEIIGKGFGSEMRTRELVNGDIHKFIAILREQPFAHVREEPIQ